jgi:apolipoprotein D and lipocalin family protein
MTPTPQTRHLFRRARAGRLRVLALACAATVTATAIAQGAAPAPPSASARASATSVPTADTAAAPGATATSAGVPAALQALPTLDVPPYMGIWYQVAWFPNRFQKQCVSDTSATYRQLPDGRIEVLNRCRKADGSFDEALGQARPVGTLTGTRLAPAQLQVSFLPGWLRWLPVGWGRYWVIQLADDGHYAVISEPTREYLWVLSRRPELSPADETAIRSALARQGFGDLSAWQPHPHTAR